MSCLFLFVQDWLESLYRSHWCWCPCSFASELPSHGSSPIDMERHDPLSTAASVEELPAPARTKKSRKLPPLLRELADVKDATLAFLYGGPEQQPGDYERNLERAGRIREEFVQFCTANPYFSNWRQAWAAFIASQP